MTGSLKYGPFIWWLGRGQGWLQLWALPRPPFLVDPRMALVRQCLFLGWGPPCFHVMLGIHSFPVWLTFPWENRLGSRGCIRKLLSLWDDYAEITFSPLSKYHTNIQCFLETPIIIIGIIYYILFEMYLTQPAAILLSPKAKPETRHTCSLLSSSVSIAPICRVYHHHLPDRPWS
jgi:hypothetical protein